MNKIENRPVSGEAENTYAPARNVFFKVFLEVNLVHRAR